MNRFFKGILTAAGLLLASGLIILCVAYLVIYYNSDEKDIFSGRSRLIGESDTVTRLDIDMSYGKLNIIEGDSFEIRYNNIYAPGLTEEYNDTELKLVVRSKHEIKLGGWKLGFNIGRGVGRDSGITVVVPSGMVFDTFHVEQGIGDLDADTVAAGKCVIQNGYGDISIANALFSNQSAVQTGLGNIKISQGDFKDIQIKSGIGSVDIETSDDIDSYHINADCTVGTGKVGRLKDEGFAIGLESKGNGADPISVDVKIGRIIIR